MARDLSKFTLLDRLQAGVHVNMLPSSWWPMLLLVDQVIAQFIDYPDFGPASLTHYDLPTNFVAACGCTPASTHYPTAALSQLAYGSSAGYGAYISSLSCHRC